MSTKTIQILKWTYYIFYIVFIALCVLAGTLLVNYLFSQFINPAAAANINLELNLLDVLMKVPPYYHALMWCLILAAGAKALLFYFIIKIPYSLDLSRPFTIEISKGIFYACYAALGVGIILIMAKRIAVSLTAKGLVIAKIESYVYGGAEFLMVAGILFFIASIFKRGVEIQSENDLTV